MSHTENFDVFNHPPRRKLLREKYVMSRTFWLPVAFICLTVPLVTSCSSQDRDLILCWLRPSCLPSHVSSAPKGQAQKPQNVAQRPSTPKPSATKSKPQAPLQSSGAGKTIRAAGRSNAVKCQTSAQTTISAAKPSITVSYSEPTIRADGTPLTNLARTTIYFDLGGGLIKAKDVSASTPNGGGKVVETIQFPVGSDDPVNATICVTATDALGLES